MRRELRKTAKRLEMKEESPERLLVDYDSPAFESQQYKEKRRETVREEGEEVELVTKEFEDQGASF